MAEPRVPVSRRRTLLACAGACARPGPVRAGPCQHPGSGHLNSPGVILRGVPT